MTKPRILKVLVLAALVPMLGGCAGVGGMFTGIIQSVIQLALYLAAVAAPLALSYYLYTRNN